MIKCFSYILIGEIPHQFMALSATASRKLIKNSVENTLRMSKPINVMVPPCKEDIMYGVGTFKSVTEIFYTLLERQHMPGMIVYCHTYNVF